MENLQKDFVPYELALRLKALGFDEPCFAFYKLGNIDIYYDTILQGQNHKFRNNTQLNFYGDLKEKISAPTYSQAFRWLFQKLDIEKGVMPLDAESQKLLLKELIDKVSSKHLLV
jgi:hypothetical protein